MIRYCSSKQITIPEFDWPFQMDLDENNRCVIMNQCIPWDKLAESYYQGLSSQTDRPAKDARLVIGAVMIKHKLCLSDAETVQQIQENPYLQYFVGLSGYQLEAPLASSLFVDIRKRMGQSIFEGFHRAIIDAQDGEKEKIKPEPESQEKCQNQSPDTSKECLPLVSEDENSSQKTPPLTQAN